jgi:hypothetical protein
MLLSSPLVGNFCGQAQTPSKLRLS